MRLHRIVILCGRLISRGDRLRGRGETSLDIASMRFRRKARSDDRRYEAVSRIEPDSRRFNLVARCQQRGALCCGLERVRDHDGDRLVDIAHPVTLQDIEPEHERISPND